MDERARGVGLEDIAALATLLVEPHWCVWGWRQIARKDGNVTWTKHPMVPGTNISLRTNTMTGTRYEAAEAGVIRGEADGVGWIVTGDRTRVWLDLDKCRNAETGEIAGWAQAVLDMVPGAYVELTPSGTGLRIMGRANLDVPFQGKLMMQRFLQAQDDEGLAAWGGSRECDPRAAIEIFFACARYVTVTGWDAAGDPDVDVGGLAVELRQLGERQTGDWRGRRDHAAARSGGPAKAAAEDIIGALEVMTNESLHWDDWVRVGLAVRAAMGVENEEVYAAFEAWSAKSWKHDPAACREAWDHWARSPGDRIGFGTLRWLARQAVPGWRQPSQRPEAEFDVVQEAIDSPGVRGEAAAAEPESAVQADAFGRLAARFIYIRSPRGWLDRDGELLSDQQMLGEAGGMGAAGFQVNGAKGLVVRLLRKGSPLRRAMGLTMRPGEGVLVVEDGEVKANSWRPSALVPMAGATEADAAIWLEHAGLLIPGKADRERVLNRLAWILQNPGKKINSALVLRGPQAAGKDSFLLPIVATLGSHNVGEVSGSKVGGVFNGNLRKQFLMVNEMPPAHKRDSYEEMKSWLATPPMFIPINLKGIEIFQVPNLVNTIITTNHDGAIALAEDDRRFDIVATVKVIDGETEAGKAWYRRYHSWLENGGNEAVAGYLLGRDVSVFNPYATPPMTAAKRLMIREGSHPAVVWVMSLWDKGGELARRKLVTPAEILHQGQRAEWGAGNAVSRNFAMGHVLQALRLGKWKPLSKEVTDGGKRRVVWMRNMAFDLVEKLSAEDLAEWLQNDRAKASEEFEEAQNPADDAMNNAPE